MSIIDKVRKEQIQARKDKDTVKASSLTVVMGEVETINKRTGKEMSDVEVSNLIKKTIDGLNEVANARGMTDDIKYEISILEQFVLSQLTADDIRRIKGEIGATDVKTLMAHLKANFNGQFDGKIASAIANEK